MSQQPARAPVAVSRRIWTVPNVISFIRLLGVPLFLYLMLGPQHDIAAVIVLTIGGTTDWVDGYAARRLGQVSRLGELLDPFADRLYIVATLVGFTLREVVPWWLTGALVLREVVLGVMLLLLRRRGYGPLPVHYVGKTGTFVLLGAFPLLLLAHALPGSAHWLGPVGWGLAWWALGLYWAAGVLYIAQTVRLLRADRAAGGPGLGGPPVPLSPDGTPATAPSTPSAVSPGPPVASSGASSAVTTAPPTVSSVPPAVSTAPSSASTASPSASSAPPAGGDGGLPPGGPAAAGE